jgi:uncharacterized integral membrane protein
MSSTDHTGQVAKSARRPPARAIVATLIAAVIVVFGLSNSQTVTIHWVLATTQTPLIVVIAVCGLLGFCAGWLLARRAARRKAR